jgi:hypothetical protein
MKTIAWLLLTVIALSASLNYIGAYPVWNAAATDEFHFGVTYGLNTTEGAKLLIDKVKGYTDLFVLDSWDIAQNETMLNDICDYAAGAGLKFIVYFDLISGTTPNKTATYPWHMEWLTTAKTKWGDKFLGIYLHDELGGKQLDDKEQVENASDFSDAADKFTEKIATYGSTQFAKINDIQIFTADYALYWWDYLGGYDTVFVELGWNHNTTQRIAQCRGAANVLGKDWGAIIVWETNEPPNMMTGQEMYDNILAAYTAGAKYVLVFNYPQYPETTLNEEHFDAMEKFYLYTKQYPRNMYGRTNGQVALVFPKDYGWGMRWKDDKIWGLWTETPEKAQLAWENMNKLTEKYGLKLDIIFDDARFNPRDKYSTIYFWNATIT